MKFNIKTSSNLNFYWNFGSILIIFILIQIIIGFILSINYFFYSNNIFINSFFIYYNINYGWLIRLIHRNLTSLIFILIFIHLIRRIIYKNYINKKIWITGLLILIILIIISFLGYSLIWNQISYWARIVITNFIIIIPIIGNKLLLMLWGNHYINNILLNRFFSIHYLLAILLIIFSLIHLFILHINKSTNPLNINNNIDQINLNPLFIFKDILILIIILYNFLIINIFFPIKLNNADNFNFIIIFKTPLHIEPEWYFIFFYSILRSNENKLNGLLIIIISIIIWLTIPIINFTKFINNNFIFLNKILIFILFLTIILITFIGIKSISYPYIILNKLLIIYYFINFIIIIIINKLYNLV